MEKEKGTRTTGSDDRPNLALDEAEYDEIYEEIPLPLLLPTLFLLRCARNRRGGKEGGRGGWGAVEAVAEPGEICIFVSKHYSR